MALSPNRVVPLDEEGCGKMAKAHTAPGFAGDAPFLSTQTGDRAIKIGLLKVSKFTPAQHLQFTAFSRQVRTVQQQGKECPHTVQQSAHVMAPKIHIRSAALDHEFLADGAH